MFRIDNATATGSIPTPGPVGPNPDGFFSDGVTVLPADWLNAVQEELANIIDSSPTSPALDKTDRTQVYTAILDIINNATYGALNYNNLYYVEDQQPSGTGGGGSTAATWNTRVLNTQVVSNITSASLSSNQVTLPNGTYWVLADGPARHLFGAVNNQHKLRLRNITDSVTEIVGTSETVGQNQVEVDQSRSMLSGPLVVSGGPKVYELQHYTAQTIATNGLGFPVTSGEVEVYGRIAIYKVA